MYICTLTLMKVNRITLLLRLSNHHAQLRMAENGQESGWLYMCLHLFLFAGIATRLLGSAADHIVGVTMVKADGTVVGTSPAHGVLALGRPLPPG